MPRIDSPSHGELLNQFQRVPLFAGLDEPVFGLMLRVAHPRLLRKGQVLFSRDDPGDAAYVVRRGTIAISLETADGRELVINEMRAGDCFGELALITGEPRSASAVASEPSELIVIPRAEFMAGLERDPRLMRRVLELVSRRLSATSNRESALAFSDAPARLAGALLEMERRQPAVGYLVSSQEELAQRIGVTRQSVVKILGQWRRQGWIITGRGRIILLNRPILHRLAREAGKEHL